MPQVAPTAQAVPYSRIRELAELAMRMDASASRAGDRVLRLYFGESNLPTPEFIKEAARKALADGYTFYTENSGLPSTREALARYYQAQHGVTPDPSTRIVITNSGVQALNVGIRCALDPGDEAIILTPAWPNGSAIVRMNNATPIEIAHPLVGNRYGIDFDQIAAAITPRTRLLLYTSPSNPTGWVATLEDQQRLLELARQHDLWLMADEVYERLAYNTSYSGEPAPSILRLAQPEDPVIVVQSFSKAWCMTGWRVGWLVARADLAARAAQLNEFIISCAPAFAQRAAEAALSLGEDAVKQIVAGFRRNRDFCLGALRSIPGFETPVPDGAFYLFPRVRGVTDSFASCRRILLETGVGLAPGVAFGNGGEGSIRICYAADRPILEEAMERLRLFFGRQPAAL